MFHAVNSTKFKPTQNAKCTMNFKSDRIASSVILSSSAGPTGCAACDATTDIVGVSMVSVTMARDAPTMRARRRVFPHTRTTILHPATCMVIMLGILKKSVAGTHAIRPIKHTGTTTTMTNTRTPTMRATTIMTLAMQAATMSRVGVITLPCPALERLPA